MSSLPPQTKNPSGFRQTGFVCPARYPRAGANLALAEFFKRPQGTAPVGSFTPNPLGIYDLAGNAMEWCQDFYDASQRQHVLRGGAWINCGPKSLLSSSREHAAPNR